MGLRVIKGQDSCGLAWTHVTLVIGQCVTGGEGVRGSFRCEDHQGADTGAAGLEHCWPLVGGPGGNCLRIEAVERKGMAYLLALLACCAEWAGVGIREAGPPIWAGLTGQAGSNRSTVALTLTLPLTLTVTHSL